LLRRAGALTVKTLRSRTRTMQRSRSFVGKRGVPSAPSITGRDARKRGRRSSAKSASRAEAELRSRQRIEKEYEGHACRLVDIVRGSIARHDFAEMQRIVDWPTVHPWCKAPASRECVHAELTYGYRDVKVRGSLIASPSWMRRSYSLSCL
jgi:hypothetical protein